MLRSAARLSRRAPLPSPFLPRIRSLAQAPPSRDPIELDAITRLPNGIRVATEALPGHFSGVGVYIDAGSRYENDRLRGASHLIDRLAFKGTKLRPADKMLEDLEILGGNIHCASSRETIMYQSAVFNKDVPSITGLLAETIREPLITDEEIALQIDTAAYEIGEIWSKPDLILPEVLHTAAYQGGTLGNPLLCPEERLKKIDRSVIEDYRSVFFRPERIVIAFAGVDHDIAVKLVEKHFGDMKSAPPPDLSTPPPSGILSKIPFINSSSNVSTHNPAEYIPSHYTGGLLTLPPSDAPTHLPQFTHVYIAFEGLRVSDPDIYALATLQTLLGGGGAFSAGGPGKGMFSRLFTNVLNKQYWVESCIAFNHSYTDSGLFGIAASCQQDTGIGLVEVVSRELSNLTLVSGPGSLQQEEVDRAKAQLRSSLLMNLESRMVELEDLGRQVQVHGRKISVTEMSREIEKLTVDDVRRVAEKVLRGAVKNVGQGTGVPTIVVQAKQKDLRGLGHVMKQVTKHSLGAPTAQKAIS